MVCLSLCQVLLPVASLLQVQSVREACCKFLLRQLHPSNCLGIRSFADAHSCEELLRKSHKYALQNFQEVALTEEFLLLPFCEVRQILFFHYFYSNCDFFLFLSGRPGCRITLNRSKYLSLQLPQSRYT